VSYNAYMSREVDHYKVLGVSREADIEEVKFAYRSAALNLHPDNYKGDPAEAERKLRALIQAYKAVARELEPSAWSTASSEGRTFTPQDFAREGYAAFWQPTLEARKSSARPSATPALSLSQAGSHSTRDETRMFVAFWVAAILLGIVVGGAAACYRAWSLGPEHIGFGDITLSVLIGELIYVALAGAAYALIVLTRRVVRFTLHLAHQGWRFLPGRTKDRELPKSSSGGELPADKDEGERART